MKAEQTGRTASKSFEQQRSAEVFSPQFSPSVVTIVDYSFGESPEATRPDCVMRLPTAALLIHRRGQLYETIAPGRRIAMPRMALLGPTHKGHIWETAPDTQFTLVNLAPGALRALVGLDPRDVCEQVEPLTGHILWEILHRHREQSAGGLNALLCEMIRQQGEYDWYDRRAQKALLSIKNQQFGPHVRSYADHFGVTPRTLQRVVSKAVGLTTKQVLAIQRIRHLITLTGVGWSRSIADLAQEAGFYDQSHMRYDLLRLGIEKVSQLVEGDHIITES